MGIAIEIENVDGFGDKKVYELHPEIMGSDGKLYRYVLVSTLNKKEVGIGGCFYDMPETLIFPSDRSGNVKDWRELPGSKFGENSHKKVLKGAGYNIKK
jgi:hypothetical protein